MRIGALRQRLNIEIKSTAGSTNDGHYEGREVWLPWRSNVPCAVNVRRGQEHFVRIGEDGDGQRYSKDIYFFTVRQPSVPGIDASMRLIHRGSVFDIRHIRPDGQYGRELVLECEVHDIVVGTAPVVASVSTIIPQGIVGSPYLPFSISVTGGKSPYRFIGSDLPDGLEVDEGTGEVSGTPTQIGEWDCSVTAYDAAGGYSDIDFTIIVVAASVQSYTYTITAGESTSWTGYMRSSIGSIDNTPIEGGIIQTTVSSKPVEGEGGIEISGDVEILHAALIGKDVYVDGVRLHNSDGWQFLSGMAVWWVDVGFPSFEDGETYEIEIK